MANVTVWLYNSTYPGAYAGGAGLRRAATRAALAKDPHLVRIENSEMEVDERFIDVDGFTREEYMTCRVHVLHSNAFSGFTHDGQRRQVMAGEYDTRLTLREFNVLIGGERCLRMIGADARGGDLWVKLGDYVELGGGPDDLPKTRMRLIYQRQTTPDEWHRE